MRKLSRARWVVGAGVVALAVTACGGGGDPGSDPGDSTSAPDEPAAGGTLRYYSIEPAFLFPGMTCPVPQPRSAGLPRW